MPSHSTDVLTRRAPEPDSVLRYAHHTDGLIDIYLPPADPRPSRVVSIAPQGANSADHATCHIERLSPTPGPTSRSARTDEIIPAASPTLVILLHGGFWRAAYDRIHLRSLAAALAALGCTVALPEFRRVGDGGEWPVIGQDVVAAIRRVVEVHGSPYTLVGHSAGGHLALWAGLAQTKLRANANQANAGADQTHPAADQTHPGADQTHCGADQTHPAAARLDGLRSVEQTQRSGCRPLHIVALAPVADLYAAQGLSNDAVAALLGGSPADRPQAYLDADPLRFLPTNVPVTIVHGSDDEDVPADLNRAVAKRFPQITYLELPGVDHFALIDPLAAACREVVLPAILEPVDRNR